MDSIQNKPETVNANKPLPPHSPAPDRPAAPAVVRPSAPPPMVSPKPTTASAAPDDLSDDRTEQLLEGILVQLRDMQRDPSTEDFSIMRTLAGVVQMAALACLVIALWKLTDRPISYDPVLAAVAFAGVLQVMALTFYTMNRR